MGYDASAASERALSWAIEHAGKGGRVVLVYAAKPQPDQLRVPGPGTSEEDRVLRAQRALDLAFMERTDLYGDTECSSEIRYAEPASALMELAEELDADAIVVGSRHQGRLRAVTGSVCADLLEHAIRPVVVVP